MKLMQLSFLAFALVMFILLSLIVLYYYPHGKAAIKLRLNYQCTTMEKARSLAEKDFYNGKYILVGYLSNEGRLRYMADSLIERRYGIQMLNTGCVGASDEVYEYSYTMAELLAKKLGRNFYDEIVQEARDLIGEKGSK
jgi:hypothetical protein